MSKIKSAQIAEVIVEVEIEASPDKVWRELTEGIGAWWPTEFYAGGEAGKRNYHLEARPGGRMYESWNGGGGLMWGQVVTVDPGKKLQIIGSSFPEWGGPGISYGTWVLAESEQGCSLRYSESTVGRIGEGHGAEKEKGWNYLLGGALKAHVEGKPCPEWVD